MTLDKYVLHVEHLAAVSTLKLSKLACNEGPPKMIISQLEVGDGFRSMTWPSGQERLEVVTGSLVFNSCSATECTLAYLPKVNSAENLAKRCLISNTF